MRFIILALGLFSASAFASPHILIIGDSISLGYTPYVQQADSDVIHNGFCPWFSDSTASNSNAGNSKRLLACLDSYLASGRYTIVHFNAGMHDVHIANCQKGETAHQVELSDYLFNLQQTVDKIRAYGAVPIFATTTPVETAASCHFNSDIRRYNAAAVSLMETQGISVDDLYHYMLPYQTIYHSNHGIHFTKAGYQFLSIRVLQSIQRE